MYHMTQSSYPFSTKRSIGENTEYNENWDIIIENECNDEVWYIHNTIIVINYIN